MNFTHFIVLSSLQLVIFHKLEEAMDQCHEFFKFFKSCGIGTNSELTLTVRVHLLLVWTATKQRMRQETR